MSNFMFATGIKTATRLLNGTGEQFVRTSWKSKLSGKSRRDINLIDMRVETNPRKTAGKRLRILHKQLGKRFLSFDLTYGHHVNGTIYEYLLDNGMTREEYHWFLQQHVRHRCVMGNDYYATNENLVHADGSIALSGEIFGYYPITRQYYDRYKLPVMHTETNSSSEGAVQWLRKEWANVRRLKQDGVPIIGFTSYSLQDQVDWDTGLRENNGRVNSFGLCDLDRNIRPVGEAYKSLIKSWKPTLEVKGTILGICY